MILLTGSTGTVGRALLPQLLKRGDVVRVLVRDPRRLGRRRVDVQLALGDLASLGDPHVQRQALRGVDTVIHLAASIRDQPQAPVEELTGLATARLLRAAERMGAERFLFFSAIGANEFQRTRFFRAKALAERAVANSELETTIFAPSIVYDRDDSWVTLMRRLSLLPVLPIAGSGQAAFQPIWAADASRCVTAVLDGAGASRIELAGPETLTYDHMARLIAQASRRERPLVHLPLGLVRAGLVWLRRIVGDAAFATWEEAELMEVPMTSKRGDADVRSLGVEPRAMAAVLGAR
ncbi:MAG: NAD(P)H-binding protein [bacterium]